MHFDISLIPTEMVDFLKKAGQFTTTIDNALQSGVAIDVTATIDTVFGTTTPEAIREVLIATANTALVAIGKLENAIETPAVEGIFQRLGADLAQIAHDNPKHTLSDYISDFEVILHNLFNKGGSTAATTETISA